MKGIYPSILSADFGKLAEEIKLVENAGVQGIHCDIMDGHFVPNITYGSMIVSKVNEITTLPLDVHLMIENPDKYIGDFVKAGADYISVHFENNMHLHRTVSIIKSEGIKAGVAINPSTPVDFLCDILPELDFVLVMSVNPGFGGQNFIERSLKKIRQLKDVIIHEKYKTIIEVDGGIDESNIRTVFEAGADMFVAGAAIFKSENKARTVKNMLKNIEMK
ncbi:MAG: ribulose-phosphate 3-epimerase [Ignavibacteria bacterium]|nr:ribulose-phosphate 3-epimerase [Ignavibacteria bacterium]